MTNRDAAEKLSAIVDLYGIDMSDEENTAIDAAIAALCPVRYPMDRTPEPENDKAYLHEVDKTDELCSPIYNYEYFVQRENEEVIRCTYAACTVSLYAGWQDLPDDSASYTAVRAPEVE